MRISDWSSDVCSSDLKDDNIEFDLFGHHAVSALVLVSARASRRISMPPLTAIRAVARPTKRSGQFVPSQSTNAPAIRMPPLEMKSLKLNVVAARRFTSFRSEEHTSELQSLMRISYAVFCLKNKKTHKALKQT